MTYQPKPLQLNVRDFGNLTPELRGVVSQIAESLNPYLREVQSGFSGQMTWENLSAVVRTVEFIAPSPWLAVSPGVSVSIVESPYYMRDQTGMIRLKGVLYRASTATPVFNIPAAYAPPAYGIAHTAPYNTGALSFLRIWVDSTGAGWGDAANTTGYHVLTGAAYFPGTLAPVTLPSPFPLLVDVSSLSGQPRGVLVLDCEDISSNSSVGALCPRLTWDCTSTNGKNYISISNATDLIPGKKYRLTLLVTT